MYDQETGDPLYLHKDDIEDVYFLYTMERNFLRESDIVRTNIFSGNKESLIKFLTEELKKENLIINKDFNYDQLPYPYRNSQINICGYYYEDAMIGFLSIIKMFQPKKGIIPHKGLPPDYEES